MKRALICTAVVLALVAAVQTAEAQDELPVNSHPATDTYPGWELGIQTFTFRQYTLLEAIDRTAALGLDWVEAFPGQKIGGSYPDTNFRPGISDAARRTVRKKLDQADVDLINYGVVGLPNNEQKCRNVFDFAAAMGVETIVSEPPMEALDMIEELCREYDIRVAIHNHPKPSPYWSPDRVLKASQGREGWIGACADPGHWERSGIDPVLGLKKLEGHIVSLHLKDVKNGDAMVWGTGGEEGNDIRRILKELDRQDWQGMMSMEYEAQSDKLMSELRRCISHYDRHAGGMSGGKGYIPLMEKHWISEPGAWNYSEGVLSLNQEYTGPGGNIWTLHRYRDFVLDLEFKLAKGTNSGVFLRLDRYHNILSGLEVQILDSRGEDLNRHICGAIYDAKAPSANPVRPPGEWNHYTITCKDNRVTVVLNDTQVIDMDLRRWSKAKQNPDGSKNKFSYPLSDRINTKGRIGLQDHGKPVWFRNIKLKRLD